MSYLSLVELKARHGITSSNEDEKLTLALDDAIGFVEWITGRKFDGDTAVVAEEHDVTVKVPTSDYTSYFLKNFPVKTVDAVRFNGDALTTNDYMIKKNTGRLLIAGSVYGKLRAYENFAVVSVDYTYGYSEEVPAGINAVISQLAFALARGAGQSSSMEKIGDYQIQRANYLGMISQDLMNVLKSYSKVHI